MTSWDLEGERSHEEATQKKKTQRILRKYFGLTGRRKGSVAPTGLLSSRHIPRACARGYYLPPLRGSNVRHSRTYFSASSMTLKYRLWTSCVRRSARESSTSSPSSASRSEE